MKIIETIVESCEDCRFCQRFYRISDDREYAFICKKSQRAIEMGNHPEPDRLYKPHILPEWCPLEAYREAEKYEACESTKPRTIILPGLPHLEWMTENLSGFGGTEVDGRWYYTYNEAVAAVKQLGNGWRLMTRGEAVDLAPWVASGRKVARMVSPVVCSVAGCSLKPRASATGRREP